MKIYEIGTGYTPIPAQMGAATEIVVEELTKAFMRKAIPVEIVDIAADCRAEHKLPIRDVKVPECFTGTDIRLGIMHKLKRVVYSIALAGELKKILKQSNEKVVLHFHNQYNLFFFLKLTPKKLRSKCVVAYTNHSGIWRLAWNTVQDTIKKRYFQEAECMKQANVVFLLNQETKYNVMQYLGIPENRIVVINNGVNTAVYCPLSEQEKEQAKERYCLQNRRVILQVGSVYENKGQLRAVEYLMPLLKKYPDLVYAYAGGIVDQEYQNQIQKIALESGLSDQIRYLGMLSPGKKLNELYNTATATILPSRYEGFSLVSVESCAAGIPVFVDQLGPVRIGEGSINFTHEQFVSCAEQFFMEDISHLCEAARANAVNNYSWEKIAGDYLTELTDMMV